MGTIIITAKSNQISEKGAKGIKESILAGPATGSSKFSIRNIEIAPEGRTAKKSFPLPVVYFVNKGKIALSHGEGELDILPQGSTVTLQKEEFHHLHNTTSEKVSVLMVTSQ